MDYNDLTPGIFGNTTEHTRRTVSYHYIIYIIYDGSTQGLQNTIYKP